MRYSLLIFGSISAILLLCTPGKYIRKLHFPGFIGNRIFLVILQQGTHIFLIYHICYIWKVEDKEKPFALAVILSPFEHHLSASVVLSGMRAPWRWLPLVARFPESSFHDICFPAFKFCISL